MALKTSARIAAAVKVTKTRSHRHHVNDIAAVAGPSRKRIAHPNRRETTDDGDTDVDSSMTDITLVNEHERDFTPLTYAEDYVDEKGKFRATYAKDYTDVKGKSRATYPVAKLESQEDAEVSIIFGRRDEFGLRELFVPPIPLRRLGPLKIRFDDVPCIWMPTMKQAVLPPLIDPKPLRSLPPIPSGPFEVEHIVNVNVMTPSTSSTSQLQPATGVDEIVNEGGWTLKERPCIRCQKDKICCIVRTDRRTRRGPCCVICYSLGNHNSERSTNGHKRKAFESDDSDSVRPAKRPRRR